MALKKGFTTGTCAQAAAKAAGLMLVKQRPLKIIEVKTPSGVRYRLKLSGQEIKKDFARCSVIKYSGDNPDVTDGIEISAKVRFCGKKGITIKGGEGIGRITKPGLALKTGEWAINPVPRNMIINELSGLLPEDKGIETTISAPKGKEVAKQTYNPKLGIKGGISIIGTTGVVKPKSLAAYKTSLALELNVLKAQGYKKAVLVFGYVGENFCRKKLKLKNDSFVKIGDHAGFMLKECARRKIGRALLIGHIGKLIKICAGQFDTHFTHGDNRINLMAYYAGLCDAEAETIKRILKESTAEAASEILLQAGLKKAFTMIAKDAAAKAKELVGNTPKVDCIVLSLEGRILGKT